MVQGAVQHALVEVAGVVQAEGLVVSIRWVHRLVRATLASSGAYQILINNLRTLIMIEMKAPLLRVRRANIQRFKLVIYRFVVSVLDLHTRRHRSVIMSRQVWPPAPQTDVFSALIELLSIHV